MDEVLGHIESRISSEVIHHLSLPFTADEATNEDANALRRILSSYTLASGQEINLEKSTMVFCPSTSQAKQEEIQSILGFRIEDKHDKYLGMPASMGKSRKAIFQFLRDRVWARVKGWCEKSLFRAGNEVLIKSVLQAIPSHVMSCFLLPRGIINDLESIIHRFWWGNKGGSSVAWLAWAKMCKSKELGGMGFWDLYSFNLALLAKQAWRIC